MNKRTRRGDASTLRTERRRLEKLLKEFTDDAPKYMADLLTLNPRHKVARHIYDGDHEDLLAEEEDEESCANDNSTSVGPEEHNDSDFGADGDDEPDTDADADADADADDQRALQQASNALDGERQMHKQEPPERRTIGMPSAFGRANCVDHGLEGLVKLELELRKGQAHDAIDKIREHIGKKSVLYRTTVRSAKQSQSNSAAARGLVDAQTAKVNLHRLYYNRARDAMHALVDNKDDVKEYEPMTANDLQSSTAELDPAARGLRHKGLSWFWYLDINKAVGGDDGPRLMNECELFYIVVELNGTD